MPTTRNINIAFSLNHSCNYEHDSVITHVMFNLELSLRLKLKKKLGHKNEIIQNLIQVITTQNSVANIVAEGDHNAAMKTNSFVAEVKSLSIAASGSKDLDNEWKD